MPKKDTRIALFSFFVSHKKTLGQILLYNNTVYEMVEESR